MDLILVMKERLRDQNSETRSIIRTYLVLTLISFVFIGLALYTTGVSRNERAYFSPSSNHSDFSAERTSTSAYAFSFCLVGYGLLVLALKTVSGISKVYRSSGGWQTTRGVATAVVSPVRIATSVSSSTAGSNDATWQRYLPHSFGALTILMLWLVFQESVSLTWVLLAQSLHCLIFGKYSHWLITCYNH